MDFSRFLEMFLAILPCAVVLSVCIGVGGYVCHISSGDWCARMASLKLKKSAPRSTYTADDMTTLTIMAKVNTDPLLRGNAVLSDMKNVPLFCFWILLQRDMKRCCGPLGPWHLHGM